MGKVIAIVNQKGGVGKTTTSINLSASLGFLGKKVLLVDLDPQGNATTGVGVYDENISSSIYEVLITKNDISDTIIKTRYKNLDLLPALTSLAYVNKAFDKLEKYYESMGEKFSPLERLKEEIDKVRDKYDFVIIDCPPSDGIFMDSAFIAADSVLIPVQCEYFSLEGINQISKNIMNKRNMYGISLELEGILLTMFSTNTNLGLEVIENVNNIFKGVVYDTIIPRLIKLAEAPSHGMPILEYEPRSKGNIAYINLAKEVIARNGSKKESSR